MDDDERAIMVFMLDHLERVSDAYDAKLREYIIAASNRLYDITQKEEPD